MADTPNLKLPEIEHQEVNGDVTHNDGLWIMDMHGQSTVQNRTAVPPGSPNEGEAYIIAPGATGDWSGLDNQVAQRRGGIWNYYLPADGWRFYNATDQLIWKFDGSIWEVYIAGDIPPNQSFQAQEEFPPEGTPLPVAVSASTWTKIPFSSDSSVGLEFSYNGGAYELTYTGQNAVATASHNIVVSGTFANDADYLARVRNQTQSLTICESAVGLTNRTPNLISLSGSLMDLLSTNDVIVCEIQASHATTLNISGGWNLHKEYNV